jgi:hypothetical protein
VTGTSDERECSERLVWNVRLSSTRDSELEEDRKKIEERGEEDSELFDRIGRLTIEKASWEPKLRFMNYSKRFYWLL